MGAEDHQAEACGTAGDLPLHSLGQQAVVHQPREVLQQGPFFILVHLSKTWLM